MAGKKDFNKTLKKELSQQLPLAFARPEDPLLGGTMTAVVVRGDEAEIDEALLHGRSALERGIRWTKERGEVPDGITYWVVWVAMRSGPSGMVYVGMMAEDMIIDREARRGYKDLVQQVNRMSDALAGKVDLGAMPETERAAFRALLISKGREMIERSGEDIRTALLEG